MKTRSLSVKIHQRCFVTVLHPASCLPTIATRRLMIQKLTNTNPKSHLKLIKVKVISALNSHRGAGKLCIKLTKTTSLICSAFNISSNLGNQIMILPNLASFNHRLGKAWPSLAHSLTLRRWVKSSGRDRQRIWVLVLRQAWVGMSLKRSA